MNVVYKRCCGLDVHKKSVVACLIVGNKREVRSFGTMTNDIRGMAKWLCENDCEVVAMESTGVYWKPIYNVLELLGCEVIVANAQHIKNVPGRKTDVKDAQWIAEIVQHGLINPSFIPNREQREMRDIVRYRKNMVEERSREINRLEKHLEGANIKLSLVVSDLTGVTSTNILKQLLQDDLNADNIDALLCGKLREKRDELLLACDGVLSETLKVLVRMILDHIEDMTKRISEMDNFINGKMGENDIMLKMLQEIPGVGKRSAEVIVSEIGIDMSRFPSEKHLSKWAGLCPGNNESAGKKKSGKTGKGNKTLKSILIQCAQVASRKDGSFFKAQYERLVVRRGANRAKVAVAHSMLIAIYHMMKDGTEFKDLGADYYNQFNAERKINHYLKKLTQLGWTVPTAVLT